MEYNQDVTISEVGPRDGLQSLGATMSTDNKERWIRALIAAGVQEIEIGSFVRADLLPQMADTGQLHQRLADVNSKAEFLALVPNLRGGQNAVACGVYNLSMPISASREHSQSNIGMSPEDAVKQISAVRDLLRESGAKNPSLEVGISTAFGCTVEGPINEDWVIDLARMCVAAGADSVGLSDTVGYANPAQVRRLFTRLRSELGEYAGAAHLHNTRGLGLANVVAALESGVTTFDSSQAGLGGCPYAPGASGNIVTEDLVFMLESMGLRTGIDLDGLLEAREVLHRGLPQAELYGSIPDAGVPKGFKYAGVSV